MALTLDIFVENFQIAGMNCQKYKNPILTIRAYTLDNRQFTDARPPGIKILSQTMIDTKSVINGLTSKQF